MGAENEWQMDKRGHAANYFNFLYLYPIKVKEQSTYSIHIYR